MQAAQPSRPGHMLGVYKVLDLSTRLGWLAGRILGDLGADVIKIEPPGAVLDDPEWQALNVNKRLLQLDTSHRAGQQVVEEMISRIDILIETARPGDPATAWLQPERLSALNPDLIHVSITPFGCYGPRASWRASDLEIMAAGGAMSLAGEPDGTPLRISVPQAHSWAGAQAASGALIALSHRTAGGGGQHVDVSAQAAVVVALAHAPTFFDILGEVPSRAGSHITGRSVHGAVYRAFWRCKDGYINFVVYGGPAGRRTNKALVGWMREKGLELGPLADFNWDRFDPKLATQEEVDRIEAPLAAFFESITKAEFLAEACTREMLGYPVSTVADIAADPQLEARSFWQDLPATDGASQRHCGVFYIADTVRPQLTKPRLEDCGKILQELGPTNEKSRSGAGSASRRDRMNKTPQALENVKVVEFGGYAAGPHIGKMLGNSGATVVHLESHSRPDGFRLEYPPFKDGIAGVNRGGCFAFFNDSKYGVTVDLKKPEGVELARRLIEWADIVIENMRPGVMARIGLAYEDLCKTKPGLIMLSTCNMGQTGPRAQTPGFGSQLSSLAGFCGATGAADGPPMLLYGPYIDFIASLMGSSAVLAALDYQRRSGKGSWIDISQYECGLHFMASAIFAYHRDGSVSKRNANLDPQAAPHGAYQCKDGTWLALSCWSDAEFKAMAETLDYPAMAQDPRFISCEERRGNLQALDTILSKRLHERAALSTAQALQKAGVSAYPVNTMADLFADPQLDARKSWCRRPHAEIGEQAYLKPAYELSSTPTDIHRAAPLLGGDNELVFKNFLAMDEDEYDAYAAKEAFN